MTDPLRAKRDDPDGAARLADELNRAGATDIVITVPLATPRPESEVEEINEFDATGETVSSMSTVDFTSLTKGVPLNGYDEMFISVSGGIVFSNTGSGNTNALSARLYDANESESGTSQRQFVPASTSDWSCLSTSWAHRRTDDALLTFSGRKWNSSSNIDIEDITIMGTVTRRNAQPRSWTEVAFASDDDALILRRATLAISTSTPWTRNTSNYHRIKAGVASGDSSRIDYIGDGFDGSKLGLPNNGTARLTGTADADIALPSGKLVVIQSERLGSPGDLRGASVQIVIGRKGS